jgi:hypothetical protein
MPTYLFETVNEFNMRKLELVAVLGILTLTLSVAHAAVVKNNSESSSKIDKIQIQLSKLHQKIEDNERTMHLQSQEAKKILLEQSELTAQLLIAETNERETRSHLNELQKELSQSASLNGIANVLNIIGMILGIGGGLLMAGAQLSTRQERIPTLRATRPLMDLSMHDTQQVPILNFFGLIGGIAIALGFMLQFAALLVNASYSITTLILYFLLALALVTSLVWFLLGHSYEQTRSEKVQIIAYNIHRHIILPMWRRVTFTRSIACQVCLRNVAPEDVEIWWLYEENLKNFPYSNQPYDFNYGHKGCLSCSHDYVEFFRNPKKYERVQLGKATGVEFITKVVPTYQAWYEDFHKHWSGVRGVPSNETALEQQLKRVASDITKKIKFERKQTRKVDDGKETNNLDPDSNDR